MTAWDPRRADRDRRIIRLAQKHCPPAEIALKIAGLEARYVATLLARARRRGEHVPRFKSRGESRAARTPRLSLKVSGDSLDRLAGSASARGLSIEALVERLIAVVAHDPALVDAVLDDRVTRQAA